MIRELAALVGLVSAGVALGFPLGYVIGLARGSLAIQRLSDALGVDPSDRRILEAIRGPDEGGPLTGKIGERNAPHHW